MKLRDLLEQSKDHPELLDYDLCLSHLISVPDESPEDGNIAIIEDYPICGIAANADSKEIRFILTASNLSALKQTNHILTLVPEKK